MERDHPRSSQKWSKKHFLSKSKRISLTMRHGIVKKYALSLGTVFEDIYHLQQGWHTLSQASMRHEGPDGRRRYRRLGGTTSHIQDFISFKTCRVITTCSNCSDCATLQWTVQTAVITFRDFITNPIEDGDSWSNSHWVCTMAQEQEAYLCTDPEALITEGLSRSVFAMSNFTRG